MPLLLLIPLGLGGIWFANKQLQETENLAIKGLVIAGVAYVAWANRGAIAKALR